MSTSLGTPEPAVRHALIDIHSLSYRYPSRSELVLDGVSFSLAPGEYVALVGANGSGKSTLARCVCGLLEPPPGSVNVGGLDPSKRADAFEIRKRLSLVFQSPPDQIVASVVEEDVAFGLENLGVPKSDMDTRVEAALRAVDLWSVRKRPTRFLSAGQQQRLALAGAMVMEPKAIIFDEATAMIDPAGRESILDHMDILAEGGTAILHITHDMGEAARADRVLVLSGGRLVYDGRPQALFEREDVSAWALAEPPSMATARALGMKAVAGESARDFGRRLAGLSVLRPSKEAAHGAPPTEAAEGDSLAWSATTAGFSYLKGTDQETKALEGVDLALSGGCSLALVGGTGSGKSTLLQLLSALAEPSEGRVLVFGQDAQDPKTDVRKLRMRSPLAVQRPETAIFELYAADEVSFGPRNAGLEGKALVERVRSAMDTVGLPYAQFRDRQCRALSGGQKRRLALASILAMEPDGLVLDEPTSALDPLSRQALMDVIWSRVEAGRALVFSTHSMEEAARADLVAVMRGGRLVALGPPSSVFGPAWREDWGIGLPFAAELSRSARQEGLDLPDGIIDLAGLAAACGALASVGREAP